MKHLKWFVLMVGVLMLTTPQLGWVEGIDYLQADDIRGSYEKMSVAAPGFPVERIAHHQAQRFLTHYLLGSFTHFTGIDRAVAYRAAVLVLYLLLFLAMARLIQRIRGKEDDWEWLLALLFFNPYFFRYYWIAPGMISDVAFMLFSVLIAEFAIRRKQLPLILCFVLAFLNKQTVVFLLPALFFWFWASRSSARDFVLRAGSVLGSFLVAFFVVNAFVAPWAEPNSSAGFFLFLVEFFQSDRNIWRELSEHLVRVFLPAGLAAALFFSAFRKRKVSALVLFLGLGALGMIGQPVLGGPAIVGKNAGRLASLAMPWVVLCLASLPVYFPGAAWKRAILLALIVLSSFHHLYCRPALPSMAVFLALQLICVAAAGLFYFFFVRDEEPRSS